jgi:hypothetical protein
MDYKAIAKDWLSLINSRIYGGHAAEEFAQKHGISYLGKGTTRIVFKVGKNKVIKLPLGKYTIENNLDEIAHWNKLSTYRKRFYAKIFEYDPEGSYIIMEHIPYCGTDSDLDDIPDIVINLIEDTCAFNFGRRDNGRWVVLDYAS